VAKSIDTTPLAELAADLRGLADEADDFARLVIDKVAHDVVADAQTFAPVDTGNLRSSIGFDLDDDKLGASIGPTASYGAHVEFGTSRHGPQSYLSVAYARNAQPFEQAMGQIIDRFGK